MKKNIVTIICLSIGLYSTAQTQPPIYIPKAATINFSELPDGEGPQLLRTLPMPNPVTGIQEQKVALFQKKIQQSPTVSVGFKSENVVPTPIYRAGYSGNFTSGTPNDNSIAVSNAGKIISAANTNIRIFNDTNSKPLATKNLAIMANALGTLSRSYDPKVIYDPNADKFIVVFLNGTTSMDNNIIVGFSQTADPMGKWNFYKLPGTREGDSSWSDYPIIAISKEDLFITVNKLYNYKGWKDGFIKSVIWQVRMDEGYKGDSLVSNYFGNNTFGGKSLWSICPVQGGSAPTHPFQYFLTVRPADLQNDSVFLYKIDNTVSSGKANISVQCIKTDRTYGLPPSAIQPPGNQVLETNDCRVLSGIYEHGKIQYCQTSIDTNTYNSCIYHGVISDPDGTPTIKGNLIKSDTLDFAYPSMAYAGAGAADLGAIVTFSFVNSRVYPGTMAVYINRDLSGYSDPLVCKSGTGAINVLVDTAERWGDYTGIARKYNEPGTCWLNGSWGDNSGLTRTWIAKVKNADAKLGAVSEQNSVLDQNSSVYPNPASDQLQIQLHLTNSEWLSFSIVSMDGKISKMIYRDTGKPGESIFSMSTYDLPSGMYILKITGNKGTALEHKFVIQR